MTDLLGSLLQAGMTPSANGRLEHSLGEKGIGAPGGVLEQVFGKRNPAAPEKSNASNPASASPLDSLEGPLASLGKMASAVLTQGTQNKSLAAGGLGAILGSILGGGSSSAKGALGGGALAMLGSIVLQAFQNAGGKQAGQLAFDPQTKLRAGLREPESAQEEKEVQGAAELIIRAMINASKADGRIDANEKENILGRIQEDRITPDHRRFLEQEMRKPMDTDSLVNAIYEPHIAAQVYAASLLAIEVDSPAEKSYLQDLAKRLRLDPKVVQHLHTALGVAA
jgi:uncharacterized membrane protein YebE (DUF533 family)